MQRRAVSDIFRKSNLCQDTHGNMNQWGAPIWQLWLLRPDFIFVSFDHLVTTKCPQVTTISRYWLVWKEIMMPVFFKLCWISYHRNQRKNDRLFLNRYGIVGSATAASTFSVSRSGPRIVSFRCLKPRLTVLLIQGLFSPCPAFPGAGELISINIM